MDDQHDPITETMKPTAPVSHDRCLLTLTAVYAVFLLFLLISFTADSAKWILSKTGPIKVPSIVAWLVLSVRVA